MSSLWMLQEAGPTQADVVGAAEAPREGVLSLFGKAASDTRAEVGAKVDGGAAAAAATTM